MILFAILFVTIVLIIWFYDRIRKMKIFRSSEEKSAERAARKAAKEEEYFRRTSQKHYREEEKVNFEDNYFKSTDSEEKSKNNRQEEDLNVKASRQMVNSDGVTIIDERVEKTTSSQEKKIFNDDEGEYAEFEEVKD